MNTAQELNEVRAELTRLHTLKRNTEWRSTAYRAQVDIDALKIRRKELRAALKKES